MFSLVEILSFTDAIAATAIQLRRQRRMSLGDSLVAATAMEHGIPLWTHNVRDFSWIEGLTVYDPLQ